MQKGNDKSEENMQCKEISIQRDMWNIDLQFSHVLPGLYDGLPYELPKKVIWKFQNSKYQCKIRY